MPLQAAFEEIPIDRLPGGDEYLTVGRRDPPRSISRIDHGSPGVGQQRIVLVSARIDLLRTITRIRF